MKTQDVSKHRSHNLLTPKELAKREGVSLRTAQRMLKRDFIPCDLTAFNGIAIPGRTVGVDGKSYLHFRQGSGKRSYVPSSRIFDSLRHIRHHLRKADDIACESGVEDRVLVAMQSIAQQATEIATRWASTRGVRNVIQQRKWNRVSKQYPCPGCGKPDWCTVTADGALACCMRVQSDRRARNGGWLHRVGDAATVHRGQLVPPCDRKLGLDCGAYHAALRRHWDWRWCDGLALDLGVSMDALEALQAAYDGVNDAFAFPMRNGNGGVCGIRLRARDGRKWAVRGSCDGLFFDPALAGNDDLVICEGPTDTAAALTLGLRAVGRPSCNGGNDALAALVRRLGVRRVTVVADHDAPHRRPDGSVWYPGRDGALAMARALRRAWRMVLPPAKDLRAWLHRGATREQFDALAASATWRLG